MIRMVGATGNISAQNCDWRRSKCEAFVTREFTNAPKNDVYNGFRVRLCKRHAPANAA